MIKSVLVFTFSLFLISSVASADKKVYISFDNNCEVYDLALTDDNRVVGHEIGCDSLKNIYVEGTYITLWPGVYDQNSLMLMLVVDFDEPNETGQNTYIEYLDPFTQSASVYSHGGGTNQFKFRTPYNINQTLGQSTETRK